MPRPAKTITTNQLNPGATYLVRGKVGFCRITRHTTDEERERANRMRTHPIDRNYTTVTIYNAAVICRNPQNPTIEEQYANECLYLSSSPNYPGKNFNGINKSNRLPSVAVTDGPSNPGNYNWITPESELAPGLDVTLVMRVFTGKGRNGVSLDTVLINENPVRYYGGSELKQNLAEYGITLPEKEPMHIVQQEPVVNEQPVMSATPINNASGSFSMPETMPFATEPQEVVPNYDQQPMQMTAPIQPTQPMPQQQSAQIPIATDNPFSNYDAQNGPNITFGGQPLGPGTRQY